MKAKFSLIVLAVALCIGTANAQIGNLMKKAKDAKNKVTETTNSNSSFVPDSKTIQPDAAIANVEGRLKSINETYYPNYKSKGIDYLNGNGQLWFIRKDFEAARNFYTGGKEGYHSRGVVCDLGPAQTDPRYVALKPKMQETEAKVLEMEKAKGYEFVECKDDNIIFKDLKTGKILSADESSKI